MRRPGLHPVRIVAVATHPVPYQAHLYRRIALDPRVELTVLYASSAGVSPYEDLGFGGEVIQWDVDLLGGYRHAFLRKARTNRVRGFFSLCDWDVVRELDPSKHDVVWVHGYSYLTVWLAIATAKARAMPLMLREEQTLLHKRPWWKALIRSPILRALFRRTIALAIGSNNAAYFRHYGVDGHRMFLVPYTTDNSDWQAQAATLQPLRAEIRARLGLDDDVPVILFVGKLQPKKQPGLLLEAFRRVRKVHPCALLFVGSGALEADLRDRVVAESIPDVHFAGFWNRQEIARAYVIADVFALTSLVDETWGMVVNEAMNFSLPIVLTNKVGSAPDLVAQGENGYVVPFDDVEALAAALERLVADGGLRRRMGKASLDRISRWGPERAATGLVNAALSAVGRSAANSGER